METLKQRTNVTLLMNTVVTELLGEGAVSGLALKNTQTGETSQIPVNGIFEAVGQLPEKALSASLVNVDESGFILSSEDCLTDAAGIFAAGDCRAKEVRQLTTACADGAVSALAACKFCDHH